MTSITPRGKQLLSDFNFIFSLIHFTCQNENGERKENRRLQNEEEEEGRRTKKNKEEQRIRKHGR